MLAGVTVVDPDATWIDADVEIEPDAMIEPGHHAARRDARSARGAVVGPHTTLIDSTLGAEVAGAATPTSSSATSPSAARSGRSPTCAPDATLREGAKAGAFVEIKNSEVGRGQPRSRTCPTSATPRSARASNIGAGTITANYDGFRKHRTVIGDHVAHRG